MEENKKVFIRGCKGRWNEIKGILTGLGATATHESFFDDNFIYFINHNNKISIALVSSEVGAIIIDNYKEIQLPQKQWKDGDVLVNSNYPGYYAVFKKYNDNVSFEAYFVLGDKSLLFDTTAYVEGYHLASEEEIKNLPRLFCLVMGILNVDGMCLPRKEIMEEFKSMDWKEALNVMREQHVAVRRKNWSGEKYIFLVPECDVKADTYIALGYHPNSNRLVHFVDHILIHTKDNKLGFYATTQCDMMANDWEVLPKEEGDD